MKGVNNKLARREYGKLARRNLLWPDSRAAVAMKKAANRRVRHANYAAFNGGSYKSLMDLRFVRDH